MNYEESKLSEPYDYIREKTGEKGSPVLMSKVSKYHLRDRIYRFGNENPS